MKAEQPKLKARRLVFIDETAVTTKMVRQYGRAPIGDRLVAKVPHGHWKTLTLVAALSVNAYSKIKSGLRKAAARTVDDLTKAAGRCIKAIAPSDCAGYFRNAGYRA